MTTTAVHAHAEAWAFVLRHRSMIRAFCRRWLGALPAQDRDEAMQMAIVRIVEKHHTLRLDGAKKPAAVISTWIGFQVRATLTTARRAKAKAERAGVGRLVEVGGAVAVGTGRTGDDGEATGFAIPAPEGTEPDRHVTDGDSLSQVEALWLIATPRQREAIRSHLEADDAARAKARGFRTLRDRDAVLRTLQPAAEA